MADRRQPGQASLEALGITTVVAALLGLAAAAAPGAGRTLLRAALPADEATVTARRLATVERLVDVDLAAFLAYRASPGRDPALDWSTDLCSAPIVGGTGRSFAFTDACIRHDFGYRNAKRLGRFGADKSRIDRRFLADMRASCGRGPPRLRERCRRWALTFYVAVRELG